MKKSKRLPVELSVNDLVIDGISDGDYFDCNESVPVTLPAVNDTDIRVLTCEDESVVIKPMKLYKLQ